MQKWPFLIGDIIALVACYVIYNMGGETFETGKAVACVACVVFGAIFSAYPFIQEYRMDARFAEADQLAEVTQFMDRLEKVKNGVTVATAHLETAQDFSEKTIDASREIAERMTEEAKAFAEFMAKANDTEKSHLQLEVDKLKQAEGEWLKVVVTTLDETFRIHAAAAQAGNTGVAAQLAKFQAVCRAAAGRVGLVPFEPEFGEPFNSEKHVLPDADAEVPEDARVGGAFAPGYTYLRRPLRPALVQLQGVQTPPPAASAPEAPAEPADSLEEEAPPAPEPAEEAATEASDDVIEPADDAEEISESPDASVEDALADALDEAADESGEPENEEAFLDEIDQEPNHDEADAAVEDEEDDPQEEESGDDDDPSTFSDDDEAEFIAQQIREAEAEAAASNDPGEDDDEDESREKQTELL